MSISSSKQHSETTQSAEPSTPKTRIKRPIWEIVAEIGAQIPDEEWANLPNDGSVNYKHYLYGVPKHNK